MISFNRGVGQKIGDSLGDVLEVDAKGVEVGWRRGLRIKVVIDITNPLERGRALVIEGKSLWISFKYEKLPLFCFNCG